MKLIAKAIAAACSAATVSITAAASDGHITGIEGIIIVLGTIGAGALVWTVPNEAPPSS